MPGAAQSQIRIGWVGVARSTPDYFTLQVLNTILGGSFTSRLNQNLREEHGYAYGASSALRHAPARRRRSSPAPACRPTRHPSRCASSSRSSTRSASRSDAEELTKAKNYIALGFPSEFETIERPLQPPRGDDRLQAAGRLLRALLRQHSGGDVAGAWPRPRPPTFSRSKFAVVVVGDRKVIEAGVRALKLGPVKVMTVDEVLGS